MTPHDARRALWQRQLAEQQASGLSITAWCFQHDISEPTFYYWRKRLAAPSPSHATSQWVALAPLHAGIPLTLRVGRVAIDVAAGFDPSLLSAVLAVLEGR